MDKKSLFSEVPFSYGKCVAENCIVAEQCLRRQLYAVRPVEEKLMCIVNPDVVAPQKGEECPYFHSSVPLRMARGFSKALATVPHGHVKYVQQELMDHYCRSLYYYYRKGERILEPKQQKYISEVLLKYGASAPVEFDAYEEGYIWE